ncbi:MULTISPECIES: ATP-binding protein [Stenotrophomonas]|jgi:PAS domain S-box-containing protein|uniref:histidine kinase n=1 Tax=Stenotrophomonas maltophilia TaxID=40324 RepID=A0ABD7C2P3_STEMA|nr:MULTISPECIES: ATP-binding protein [Stenotrophomonas]NED65566.1 PAS domain-containing protein [Streptomyces sp. SID10244]EKT4087895.1 PAS domain-containing protein [Stenotrophomonas maltophilia]EKU9961328.1 PAS domain-containing protein [Stenotrophomonas maltophilia]EKU9987729.1 PAS domain-containing protein [Stenotrophomonas maltophilia]ELN2587003.1 PAS domain-containing protein [Stenotrophomonas maltophilia]
MALVFSDDIWDRWRLPALALAAAAIIVVPWLTLRQLQQDSEDAMAWVNHTQAVGVALQQLQADVRDVESAALTLSKGVDAPGLRERMAKANDLPGRLAELGRMTRDNPEQLIRIGRIESMLEGRMALARELAKSEPNSDQRELVQDLSTRYPIRGLVEELQASEQKLLTQRAEQAARQRKQTELVSWSSLVIQLALLGLVLWLLQRQIGRRLHAERQSLRSAARAASVLQTVREPIVLLDRDLRVQLHNPAFAELYGLQDERADGLLLDTVGDGAWKDPVMRQRLSDVLLRGRELWDFEHEQRAADGMVRYMLLNARRMPLPDTDDEVVLLTVSDVTVQRAVQLRVEELNRQLEGKVAQVSEVNRELEAFSYSVSHDLRAPLRHVAGFSDKLSRHLGDAADDKSRHYLEVISSSARRMAALIDDLLVYSRLGRAAMRQQAVDMQSLVADTRAMLDSNLQAEAENSGHAHHVEWSIAPLPIVVGDENMIRQVWLNLLGNAVKYSGNREPAKIRVDYQPQPDGGHQFTVSDNGAGFDMAYAGKLFGVFQRLHKASDYPGTGIGLASVRRVLTRHGGRIWAEAEPDVGATFHFYLPPAIDADKQGPSA